MTSEPLVPEVKQERSFAPRPGHVVAIGASAGGIEALQALLPGLPWSCDAAYIVLQHQSPDFRSLLVELLQRHTRMPVSEATSAQALAPNTIIVVPARTDASVNEEGCIHLKPRDESDPVPRPIDGLFASLVSWGPRAAAVVLSGTGSDGAEGAHALRNKGGLVVAQDPLTCRFDGMPRATLQQAPAHLMLAPDAIGSALTSWLADPASSLDAQDGESAEYLSAYLPVVSALRKKFDIDLTMYKPGTVMRRLQRWAEIDLQPISPHQLAQRMERDDALADAVFMDMLVGVTRFLRDAESFDALRALALEPAIDHLGPDETLRIWCCGCSTGEEAYSVAMLVAEAFARRDQPMRLRLHATDLHPRSVQKASAGTYPPEALADLPEGWKDRYFVPLSTGQYRAADSIRKSLVFSIHNLLRDAPLPRMHVILCRNVLIYLRPATQSRALGSFFNALQEDGVLMLGNSEMPAQPDRVYDTLSDAAHLFRKRPNLRLPAHMQPQVSLPAPISAPARTAGDTRAHLRLTEVLTQRFAPMGFLVDSKDELVYVFGDAGALLRPTAGSFGSNIQQLLQGQLRTAVTLALRQAALQTGDAVVVGDSVDDPNRPDKALEVQIERISDSRLLQPYFLVRLTAREPVDRSQSSPQILDSDSFAAQHIARLEAELHQTREALQHALEEVETTGEELRAANEELQSSNEELQTSNEELHALNEELYSVNSEHELKIIELKSTTDDLNNLLTAVELAIIFLESDGRIRLFTPAALRLFPLRPTDIGRSLTELVPLEADDRLLSDLSSVKNDGQRRQFEMASVNGRSLRRRIDAYRDGDHRITGLVVSYLDVTDQVLMREQEIELRQKSLLTAIVRAVPHLIWTCRANGECDYLNPQWVNYTGIPQQAQLGEGWLQQVHPEDRERLTTAWNAAVESGQALAIRFRIRRHDGAYRWFDTRATAELDSKGRIQRWYGSNTDVHEQFELQRQLEERSAFVQLVADNINGMVGYWDRDLCNRFANRHYLEWFGKTAQEMNGITLRTLLGDVLFEMNEPMARAALRGEVQQFERVIARPDGSNGHVLAEYRPDIVGGDVRGFLATVTDITAVQEERLLVEEVFRASPLAKIVVDSDGVINRANEAAAELTLHPLEKLVGMQLEGLLPDNLRERHGSLRRHFLGGKGRRPMGEGSRFPLQRGDGSIVFVDIELAGIGIRGRSGAVAYIRPPSESDDLARRAEALAQARGSFLAQMSHEIRTPLNAILGMAQLLMLESPSSRQLDRLNRIQDASSHLLGIIDDILDFSKIEAGSMPLHVESFDLRALVSRSIEMVADRAKVKHLPISVELPRNLPGRLVADARRIEQILVNFLTNAVKFTPAGSISVKVQTSAASDGRVMLRMEVNDTGIGIAPSDQVRLFSPFQQVNQGHARRFGGTGLGLAICREIARAMHGDCGVRSALGKGSTFWCTVQVAREPLLPRETLPAKTAPAQLAADAQDVRKICANRKVLLVEDDEVNRLVAQELFHALTGLRPLPAIDGDQALQMAGSESFDLVLMDIQLPGMDGLETTRRLRQLPGYADVPVFALSANVLSEDVNACLEAGMNGHLGKPIQTSELLRMLDGLWGRQAE